MRGLLWTIAVTTGLADISTGKIHLTSNAKSGGSEADYKATAGLLEVDINVTGSADWTVQETGFLFIDAGDIEGTDLDVLKISGTNPWIKVQSQTVTLSGNLDVTLTGGNTGENCNDDGANPQWRMSTVKMTGGTSGSPVTLEIASVDKCVEESSWDVAWPFDCMGMGLELIIGADAHVKVVDVQDNNNTDGNHCTLECLFVTDLTFVDTDGRLDRNGVDTHYNTLTGNVSQLLGSQECGDCP